MNEIKVSSTRYHKVINILCLAMIIGTLIFLIFSWTSIPNQIPGHYTSTGDINRWGNKMELWIVYLLGVLMYAGISAIEHYPKMWNTGVTVTEENRTRVYGLLKGMLVTMKFCVTAIFMFLTIYTTLMIDLPWWLTPLFLVVTFGTIVIYGIRIFKAR